MFIGGGGVKCEASGKQHWSFKITIRRYASLFVSFCHFLLFGASGTETSDQVPGASVESLEAVHSIAYNLVRSLMQKAAIDHTVNLSRISFKGTADTLRHWSSSMEALRGRPSKQKAPPSAMLEIIAKDLVPLRPGREEPRARRRRPKNYHLLAKPRRNMKIRGHRNRPKSRLS